MPTTQCFKCESCCKTHKKQAFISHSKKDEVIKQKLVKACCEVGVAPYLYEFSPEYNSNASPADALSDEIAKSEMLFVLLGDSISKVYWTQAWIGFEVGIFKLLADPEKNLKYVFVFQDIRQGIGVCVPFLHVLFLFDFNSEIGWKQFRGLIVVVARDTDSKKFFTDANRFRSATIKANIKCDNCKSGYDAWIAKSDVCQLGKGLNKFRIGPQWISECTIKCPSCGKMVTRCFTPML